ncbi:PucR family transcriptional regulator [Dactylosporangium sp. CA-092794]|uniref:PucR family transcriptional regulator n=1 Tax=Dactylosporangium sp. CA-092794 TaxID=3239929 RepID=UPI003D8E5FC8
MTVEQVQEIVDALAGSLRRAVAIDDHGLRLIAVSEDFGDADPPRVWSLLHRRTRPEDVHFERIVAADGPLRLPANPALELAPRLVVPLRHLGMPVGFMWLIERDARIGEAELDACCRAAARIAELLHQRLVVADRNRELVARLLDEVTGPDAARAAGAAEDLRRRGLIADDSDVGVLLVRPRAGEAEALSDCWAQLYRFAGLFPPRTTLVDCSPHRALVLVSRPTLSAGVLAGMAVQLGQSVGPRFAVGASGVVTGLRAAPTAWRQASVAADAAAAVPHFEGVACWERLGPYALLGQLPRDVLTAAMLPAGLTALLDAGTAEHLLTTVETFLDCGGDKQRAAGLLHVHRATLYYRLERVEALTGLSLSDGADRLLVHLAIKLRRMQGGGHTGTGTAAPLAA